MDAALRWLDVLFGKGDDGYPFWLLTVRVNILLLLSCIVLVIAAHVWRTGFRAVLWGRAEICIAAALTALAGALRFLVARPNLMDFGGIGYSRLLVGYKGYFATAQSYALLYGLTARDIEHGILFQRIAGTLTIPLVYVLCRQLQPGDILFPAIAALLFAVYPLHVLFSASDTLAVFSNFLAASSYLLLAAIGRRDARRIDRLLFLGGTLGLALLTQVRYENVLLLVPAALLLFVRRHALRPRDIAWPLAVSAGFALIYAYAATTAELSYQNPINLDRGLALTTGHLVLNPFLAIPVLFIGSAAVCAYVGLARGALTLLPWVAIFLLCTITAEDGHGAARIYANWLILILPLAAYGFSQLFRSPYRLLHAVAALALLYLATLPVIMRDRLGTQYLEILENDRFKAVLSTLPPGVERMIVPDDQLMWREVHSTLEVYVKYAAILAGNPDAVRRVELVPLSEYLADQQRASCAHGACAFFSGIPCMDEPKSWLTRGQCEQFLSTRRTSVLDDRAMVAAPFVGCSIYTGTLKKELCDPTIQLRHFTLYRIEE